MRTTTRWATAAAGASLAVAVLVAPPQLAAAMQMASTDGHGGGPEITTLSVEPVDGDVPSIPAPGEAPDVDEQHSDEDVETETVAHLQQHATDEFSLVGVTWDSARDLGPVQVQIRTRGDDGWSDWESLAVDDHGDGAEQSPRDGTEPAFVGESDGVAVDVRTTEGEVPQNVKVETIALDDGGPAPTVQPMALADDSPVFPKRPAIIKRASWKAAKGGTCDKPTTGKSTFGVTLHHTAGTNSYTKAQSASIVRGIQSYHVKSRQWCDIGYNFLVDKYGQIFEGRKGGTSVTVRGAHAGDKGVNTYSMGISMMGNFDTAKVGTAMGDAIVQLAGWRLGTFYRPSDVSWSSGGKKYATVHGHRNVVSTACPGAKGYAWLPTLRSRLKTYLKDVDTPIKRYAATLTRDYTGYPYIGESGNATTRKTYFHNMEIYWKRDVGAFDVGGHYRIAYRALGEEKGVLGFPTNTRVTSGTSGVSLQRFENGTVYRVTRGGSTAGRALYGDIADTYVDEDEAAGRLGAPVSSIERTTTGHRARFVKGQIIQRGSDAPQVVLN